MRQLDPAALGELRGEGCTGGAGGVGGEGKDGQNRAVVSLAKMYLTPVGASLAKMDLHLCSRRLIARIVSIGIAGTCITDFFLSTLALASCKLGPHVVKLNRTFLSGFTAFVKTFTAVSSLVLSIFANKHRKILNNRIMHNYSLRL